LSLFHFIFSFELNIKNIKKIIIKNINPDLIIKAIKAIVNAILHAAIKNIINLYIYYSFFEIKLKNSL